MADLTHLEDLDRVSREEWSIAASEALIQSVGATAVIAIAARGLLEFIRVSKPVYAGHGFKFEDFRRMFDRINLAAERLKAGKGLGRIEKRLPRVKRH